MINFPELARLRDIIRRCENDRLLDFVASPEKDKLQDMLQANLDAIFKEARKYNVRYLYIGKGEICGCEKKKDKGGSWPAMWVSPVQLETVINTSAAVPSRLFRPSHMVAGTLLRTENLAGKKLLKRNSIL
jgi:hypothetical protein